MCLMGRQARGAIKCNSIIKRLSGDGWPALRWGRDSPLFSGPASLLFCFPRVPFTFFLFHSSFLVIGFGALSEVYKGR